MRRVAAALALATAGCALQDSRPELALLPEDVGHVNEPFAVTVRVTGGASVRLLLDGDDLAGSVQDGDSVTVDVDRLPGGAHELEARVIGAPYAVEARRRFVVDRDGPLVTFEPPGEIYRIEDAAEGVVVRLSDPAGLGVPSWSGDGEAEPLGQGRWRVRSGATSGSEWMNLQAFDAIGNRTTTSFGWTDWRPVEFELYGYEPIPLPVAGVETIVCRSQKSAPHPLRLLLDGAQVATGTGAGLFDCQISWDTRRSPDGEYLLEIEHPGERPPDAVRVRIDNTPDPGWCGPVAGSHDPAPPTVGIQVRGLRERSGAGLQPSFTADGAPLAVFGQDGVWCTIDPVQAPATLTATFPAAMLENEAGITARGDVSCSVAVAPWSGPLGPGPVAVLGEPIVARSAQIVPVSFPIAPVCGRRAVDRLLWVDPAGGPHLLFGGAPLALGQPGTVVEGLASTDGSSGAAWIQRGQGTPGQVFHQERIDLGGTALGPLNLDPSKDARDLAVLAGTTEWLAWSEEVAEGGRVVVVCLDVDWRCWALAGELGAEASAPAVGDYAVAWVERSTAGVTSLRAKRFAGDWTDLVAGPIAAGTPSSPAVLAGAEGVQLAWSEGPEVWMLVAPYAAPPSAAALMNADPSRPARWPRLIRPFQTEWLVLVQETARGDKIRVRRRASGESRSFPDSWELLDEVVNAGVPGPVSTLSVAGTPGAVGEETIAVTWTDPAGNVHVRLRTR